MVGRIVVTASLGRRGGASGSGLIRPGAKLLPRSTPLFFAGTSRLPLPLFPPRRLGRARLGRVPRSALAGTLQLLRRTDRLLEVAFHWGRQRGALLGEARVLVVGLERRGVVGHLAGVVQDVPVQEA